MRFSPWVFLALFGTFGFAMAADLPSIEVRVTDRAGAPVPGIKVTASGSTTGSVQCSPPSWRGNCVGSVPKAHETRETDSHGVAKMRATPGLTGDHAVAILRISRIMTCRKPGSTSAQTMPILQFEEAPGDCDLRFDTESEIRNAPVQARCQLTITHTVLKDRIRAFKNLSGTSNCSWD